MLEKSLEARFTTWLKLHKIKWKKKAPGELLDRWLLLPGAHLFIVELKRPDAPVARKTWKRQRLEIKQLRKLGYDVEVHDNFEELIQAVKLRLEATRLSKTGNKILATKLLRGSVLRSRFREDKYYPRRAQDPEEGEDDQ